MNDEHVIKDDRYYVNKIRQTIKELSQLVKEAEADGLTVTLALGNLGKPDWVGFKDAAQIIRKY